MDRTPESERRLIARLCAIVATLAVLLSARSAHAEPPCKNPRILPCQRASAVYSAKMQLSAQNPPIAHSTEDARQVAKFAGYTLQEVDAMTQGKSLLPSTSIAATKNGAGKSHAGG
jgi:hypothetical protein